MSTRTLLLLLIPLVLVAGALLNMQASLPLSESETISSEIVYDQDVARLVEDFGGALKNVPLFAPREELIAAIEAEYAPFVSAYLLAEWQLTPEIAPGRRTADVSPARIQFGFMESTRGGFTVHGTVVETVYESDGEEIVGSYPVEFKVENVAGMWRITRYEEGMYSEIPSRKEVIGTFTCLPHRDTSGPQTMECAFGVQEEGSGDYYAVNTMLMASTDWMDIPSGVRVRVEGVMVPAEHLSTDMWHKYDIVGILGATSIRSL